LLSRFPHRDFPIDAAKRKEQGAEYPRNGQSGELGRNNIQQGGIGGMDEDINRLIGKIMHAKQRVLKIQYSF